MDTVSKENKSRIDELEERVDMLELDEQGLEHLEEISNLTSELCRVVRRLNRKLYNPAISTVWDEGRKKQVDLANKNLLKSLRKSMEKVVESDRYSLNESSSYQDDKEYIDSLEYFVRGWNSRTSSVRDNFKKALERSKNNDD